MKRTAALVALLSTVVALVAAAGPAGAHTGDQSYVYVDLLSDRVEGRVEYLAADLNEVLGLHLTDDAEVAPAQLEAARDRIEAFTLEHVSLELAGEATDLTVDELEYLELDVGSYVIVHVTTGDLGAAPPRSFTVSYDAFFDELPDRSALLLIGRDWQGGVIANEADHLRVFSPGDTSFEIALDDGSWSRGMRSTIDLGVEHIRTGADHVMFILVLLLPSVLVFRRGRWEPAPGFGPSLLRVVKVASAFTVAHSITLSLAALDVIEVPSRLVESIIAISIVLAALHNVRPVFQNREWVLAFGFGLFHGMGFAGLLSELGLARDQQVWTLLGFNLGVELGQLAIILLLFPTLYLLRRTRFYPVVLVGGSLALALAALGWAVERVFEVELNVDSVFDPVLYYPRVLVITGVAMALAAVVHEAERRRARLVPAGGGFGGDDAAGPGLSV